MVKITPISIRTIERHKIGRSLPWINCAGKYSRIRRKSKIIQVKNQKSMTSWLPRESRLKTTRQNAEPSLQRAAADVSIPGVSKLFDQNYGLFGKIVWGLAIAICLVICTVQIGNRIGEFFKLPVEINVEVVRNSTIRFPSLTICPFYPFLYSVEIQNLRRVYALHFNVSYEDEAELAEKVESADLLDLPEVDADMLWNISGLGDVVVKNKCEFQSKKNCDADINKEDLRTYHGSCNIYYFTKRIHFDGANNGYEVLLRPTENLKHIYWRSMVYLHEMNDRPKHKAYLESGHVIHPNFETAITFQMKQYRRVNTPRHPCWHKREVQNCYWYCIESHILKNVTCKLPYIESESLPMCANSSEAKHTQAVTRNVYVELESENICTKCARKCSENVYSLMQDAVMPKNLTWFNVLLQDNTVEVVREYPSYNFNVLLSEVGGSLGLFLGVCILTALQLLEILVVHITSKFQRKL